MDTKEQASQPALQTLKEYAVITAAVLIMDIGIYVFKFPNNFSFGGVSGCLLYTSRLCRHRRRPARRSVQKALCGN